MRPFIVSIIPVRGGSKGINRKNIRLLAGKPLLWYTIESARQSSMLDMIVVSTDDDEIAHYALSEGIRVIRHPARLSKDDSPTYPVVKWALNRMRSQGIEPQICAVLRATSPLRAPKDIDEAINLLLHNKQADSVVSVVPAEGIHPIRLKRVLPDKRIVDAYEAEGNYPKRRQELELLYLRNGAIYVAWATVIDEMGMWGTHCLAYVMPEERSININTEFQFKVAELIVKDGSC